MRGLDSTGLSGARELVGQLRDLGEVVAPPSLRPGVLDRLGLGEAYASIDTPLGPAFVAFGEAGIRLLRIGTSAEEFEQAYQERFGRQPRRAGELPLTLRRGLERWANGESAAKLPFDLASLTEFERAVLRKALEIPRGEVRTYAWIAREIGHPKAVRAVGSALGHNPVPLLIPCHRVVKTDGSVGQYALGAPAKRAVLAAEGIDLEAAESLARSGIRYVGSDTTHIFCFPTCRHARRVTDAHRVRFRSEGEATAAGYRPCKICRPAG